MHAIYYDSFRPRARPRETEVLNESVRYTFEDENEHDDEDDRKITTKAVAVVLLLLDFMKVYMSTAAGLKSGQFNRKRNSSMANDK
jgi:hypothetical protein